MAYAEIPNLQIKVYYRPSRIEIQSPVGANYSDFTIIISIDKIIIDSDGNILSSTYHGQIERPLSNISQQTIVSVENEIVRLIGEDYGVQGSIGSMRNVQQ